MQSHNPIHAELELLDHAVTLLHRINTMPTLPESERALLTTQVCTLLTTGRRTAQADPFVALFDELTKTPHPELEPNGNELAPDVPPAPGFTIAQRLLTLGYRLTHIQELTVLPRLHAHIHREYKLRFDGEAMHYQGEYWYEESDSGWIDRVIAVFMIDYPDVALCVVSDGQEG